MNRPAPASLRRWLITAGLTCAALLAGCAGCDTTPLPIPADTASDTDPETENPSTPSGGSHTGGSSGTSTANPDVSDPCLQVGEPASPSHREMFTALNQYRKSKGLAQLSYSKVLEKAANAHAIDLYRRDFFDHTNPDGDGPLDRAIAAGFCRAYMIGENIAWNQQSVTEVQQAWEQSPGHNANMINPQYRYVGMGYYFSANGPYYVQLFGTVTPD